MGRKKREPLSAMGLRLKAVRAESGLTLKAFHRKLIEDGEYSVAYQSVQNYHFDRDAPVHYLARVAKVFGSDFAYLATGERSHVDNDIERGGNQFVTPPTLPFDARMGIFEAAALQLRFFGPYDSARRTGVGLPGIVADLRSRAKRPAIGGGPQEASVPTTGELEERYREELEMYALVDDVLANAWEGMRGIVAHEFGPDSVSKLTLDQQTRFRDAMLLTLTGLFPDYGEPAAFKEKTDG